MQMAAVASREDGAFSYIGDNGKEDGNYYNIQGYIGSIWGLYWSYIGVICGIRKLLKIVTARSSWRHGGPLHLF